MPTVRTDMKVNYIIHPTNLVLYRLGGRVLS